MPADERSEFSTLVASADQVLVVRGSQYDPRHRSANKVLTDVRSPTAISAIVDSLAAVPTNDVHYMTPGDPSLVFLEARRVLSVVTLLGGTDWIRCDALSRGDARLVDPDALKRWLAEHGVARVETT